MLDEIKESEEYLGYSETGLPRNDPRLVRILRILARYYWHEPPKKPVNEKVQDVVQKLEDFYTAALLSKTTQEPEQDQDRLEALEKRLERYKRPYFEYESRKYTFYSIIADAVNDGPLNGAYDGELLKKSELAYLLVLADRSNEELWDKLCNYYRLKYPRNKKRKINLILKLKISDPDAKQKKIKKRLSPLESAYSKQRIGDAIVVRIAGLIVYFRRYAENYAVKDGYLPVSIEQLNNWLGSKYLEKGKGGQGKWADVYEFVGLNTREHLPHRDDSVGSSFLKVDEDTLGAGVKEMLAGDKQGLYAGLDADPIKFPDNKLSKVIAKEIREIRVLSKEKAR